MCVVYEELEGLVVDDESLTAVPENVNKMLILSFLCVSTFHLFVFLSVAVASNIAF